MSGSWGGLEPVPAAIAINMHVLYSGRKPVPRENPNTQTPHRNTLAGIQTRNLLSILTHTRERFSCIDHLVSATLLQGDMFEQHCHTFTIDALNATVMAYPMLNVTKVKTALFPSYENGEFKGSCGALALYQVVVVLRFNLQDTFSETVALLNILISTP